MTKLRLFLIIFGIMLISITIMPIASAVPSGYTLVKADEFSGSSLDTSLWIPKYLECRTTADRAAARYSFRDGCLVLRIDKDQPTYYSNNPMKVSSIQTGQRNYLHKDEMNHSISTDMKYTPQYGYFEIRAKTTNQRGYHCAFWTVGRRDTSTQEAEIDIFEQYRASNGDSRYRFNLIKWDDPNISDNCYDTALNITSSSEFHTYGLEWDSTSLKFYVDNSLKRTINQSPKYGMVFFLSIYENSGWTGTADTTSSLYPREFIIDYFRAYSKTGSTNPITNGIYKIKSKQYNRYIDSDANGVVILYSSTQYDDQQWEVIDNGNGYYMFKNVRSGRYYLDSDSTYVIWNDGYTGDDAQWAIEAAGDGSYRFKNKRTGRYYIYGTSANELKWNTGATGEDTKWIFERVN